MYKITPSASASNTTPGTPLNCSVTLSMVDVPRPQLPVVAQMLLKRLVRTLDAERRAGSTPSFVQRVHSLIISFT